MPFCVTHSETPPGSHLFSSSTMQLDSEGQHVILPAPKLRESGCKNGNGIGSFVTFSHKTVTEMHSITWIFEDDKLHETRLDSARRWIIRAAQGDTFSGRCIWEHFRSDVLNSELPVSNNKLHSVQHSRVKVGLLKTWNSPLRFRFYDNEQHSDVIGTSSLAAPDINFRCCAT